MNWLKNAFLDVAVTIMIGLATFGQMEWARWIVTVYTPLMLLLKLLAYRGARTPSKIKPTDAGVPTVVYHVLYAANVLISAADRWWWVAACWAVIWVLSAVSGKGKPVAKR